jgi:hypothetical protein
MTDSLVATQYITCFVIVMANSKVHFNGNGLAITPEEIGDVSN